MQLPQTPEGRNMLLAGGLTLIWGLLLVAIVEQVVGVFGNTMVFTLTGLGVAVLGLLFFRSLTRRYRKRLTARKRPFPPAWQAPFADAIPEVLEDEERESLQSQVLVFLAEKPQTGVTQKPDERLRVALATAMRWPIRYYPEWDYPELLEVLWYDCSFLEEPDKYKLLVTELQHVLDEQPLVSVLPVSVPDINRVLDNPSQAHDWLQGIAGTDSVLPPSFLKAPLLLIALSYIRNVIEYGIQKGLIAQANQLAWSEFLQLADEGFYPDKKRLILADRKAAEAMDFVFQSGRLGWRRAIADLMWQRPGILGPNAPKVDELG